MTAHDALTALTRLASAEDPHQARAALGEARRALGADAGPYEELLELMCRRATELSRLRHMAGTDELTGAANRRAFGEALSREMARLARGGRGPGVVLLDLDGLKVINDRHGHAVGDAAIAATAEALRSGVRGSDLVARLGGDEFAVLVPEASEEAVRAVAARLRRMVERCAVGGRSLRVSVGWAVAERMGEGADELLAFADARLYADKGRRRASARPARAA
ncbi:MAG TPA: GGDEF domain-containing protein [Sandaracinaceae bacterium LLY-WYZ-13_1]|nr:GGDEF domain-containing protein [Sandaracinaceae bacterium LLY-WYZ-13_1]